MPRRLKKMSLIQHKRICYINSHNKLSGTDSAFTASVNITNDDDFDHVCVLRCKIPKSYYCIREGQNTFIVIENGTPRTITITPGNYSRSTFKTALQTALNNGAPSGYSYTIIIPSKTQVETGRYTYTVSGNGGIQPVFEMNSGMYEAMGFERSSSNEFASDTLVSTTVTNIQPEDTLLLHSDICENNGDDILQDIYANTSVAPFSNILYECLDIEANSKRLRTSGNNVYHFALTDEDGQAVELHSQNIVVTLLFYKANDLSRIAKAFMKMMTYEMYGQQIAEQLANEGETTDK